VPALAAEVTVEDGVYTAVAVVQDAVDPVTGAPEPRPHSLKIGFYSFDPDGSLVRTASHAVQVSGASTPAGCPDRAGAADLLLINDEDLTYAKLRFDSRSLATLLGSVDRIADPLARAICLAALWSSTRDADLAAADYLGAVELAAPAKPGWGAAGAAPERGTAVERYTAPAAQGGPAGTLRRPPRERGCAAPRKAPTPSSPGRARWPPRPQQQHRRGGCSAACSAAPMRLRGWSSTTNCGGCSWRPSRPRARPGR
jgi:hypothetical protein